MNLVMKKLLLVSIFILGFLFLFSGMGVHTSGDWLYLYPETAKQFLLTPTVWTSHSGLLGGANLFVTGLDWLYSASSKIFLVDLHLSWSLIERLLWFLPLWLIGAVGSVRFSNRFSSSVFVYLSLLFVFNTYFLMITGGGQMGVAWGYALVPWVLDGFFNLFDALRINLKHLWHKTYLVAIVFGIQLFFDARMAYLTLFVVGLYLIWLFVIREADRSFLLRCLISSFIFAISVIGLHAFWLLPFIKFPVSISESLGSVYTSIDAVKFFSFADFSHALSLLHPNWPEDIFGKTYFLQPEFLLLPIIAFSALLFIRDNSKDKWQEIQIRFFAILAIVGAFLAKGTNPPFGGLYVWLFNSIPGFVMFRDPTKFYLFIALSYSVLIPYACAHISQVVYTALKRSGTHIPLRVLAVGVFAFFIIGWSYLHRELLLGRLGGTFRSQVVPVEYIQLKDFLTADLSYKRVLWVPSKSRFGFYSDDKPGISLQAINVASSSSFISWISDQKHDEELARYSVAYIVVPTDPQSELFVSDRKYDRQLRLSVIKAIDATGRFTRVTSIPDIAVYKSNKYYGHAFWANDPNIPVVINRIEPTHYTVSIPNHKSLEDLIFSESFDPYWELIINGTRIRPVKTVDGLQQYRLQGGVYGQAIIYYRPQGFESVGLWISGITLLTIVVWIGYDSVILWHKKRAS